MRNIGETIRRFIDELMKSGPAGSVTRQHVGTFGLAASVAQRLPLPSGPVDRASEWYLINCLSTAEAVVGKVNEGYLPVDVASTMDLIKRVWLMRYRMVHEAGSQESIMATCSVLESADNELAEIYRKMVSGGRMMMFFSHIVRMMQTELRKMIPIAGEEDVD